MRLYASSEKGTEKVVDISKNENVVMYWYKQIPEDEYVPQVNDYFNSYGVQIKGTARLMTGEEDSFFRGASLYMRTLYGPERWDAWTRDPARDHRPHRAGQRVVEILPTEYNVTSLYWSFNKEDSRRPQYYDRKARISGKDAARCIS